MLLGDVSVCVIILTKNEKAAIAACIASIPEYAAVFVVDSQSTDGTADIARQCGATVVDFAWDGRYPKKKQWALDHVGSSFDWVIYLDADERLSGDLIKELPRLLANTDVVAYDVPINYVFLGRELNHGHRVVKRAIVRPDRVRFPELRDLHIANMWEVEGHYQPITRGAVVPTAGSISHADPDPLYDYFSRHNRYSDWDALLSDADRVSIDNGATNRRFFSRLPLKPLIFFLWAYVVKCGFLDGRPGFHYAIANSFYYWQIGVKRYESRVVTRGSRVPSV